MGIATRCDPANNFAVVKYGFVTEYVCRLVLVHVNSEHHELACWTGLHFCLNSSTTDELVVKLHRAFHAGFEWCVDRAELAIPSTEVLFETHRDECAEAEHSHVELFAGIPNEIKQVALIFRSNPNFVAQVTCVGHARQPHRRHADVDATE